MGTSQKGAVHLLLPLVILGAIGVFVSANIQTTTEYGNNQIKGISLAKQNAAANENNQGQSNIQGGRSEEAKQNQETRATARQTRSEEQSETKNSQLKTRTQTQEVTDETEEASDSTGEDEGEDDVGKLQDLRSISKFPLRIDTTTNQLIMTKNGVERVLTVLPAKAVQNMLRAHLKKGLGPKFFQTATSSATPVATSSASPDASSSATPSATASLPPQEPIATESAQITVLEDLITLEELNGEVVYKIPAKKHLKIIGFIPVSTNLTGFVSAQTGELLEEQESLLARILDFLSP